MKMNDPKILYIGPLMHGGTCLQRMWAFQKNCYHVFGVDTGIPSNLPPLIEFSYKAYRKLFTNNLINIVNTKIIEMAKLIKPDLVWIDKGLTIKSETLLKIKSFNPKTIFVSYSPDDMMNPNNQSQNYLECITIYDHHVTTKTFNVAELFGMGAKNVIMVNNGFCDICHKKLSLSQVDRNKFGGSVGFIGFWEKEREEYMTYLAENEIPVRVWGPWERNRSYHRNMFVEGRVAWGNEYIMAINAFDINLCFLRKENRDLQTSRSVGIPACGAFMLAERTNEHLELFKEGVEAEYFESMEEMREKVAYYLQHDDQRKKIANAGYLRCQSSGYSYDQIIKQVMENILRGANDI